MQGKGGLDRAGRRWTCGAVGVAALAGACAAGARPGDDWDFAWVDRLWTSAHAIRTTETLHVRAVREPRESGDACRVPSWVGDVDGDGFQDIALRNRLSRSSIAVHSGSDGKLLREYAIDGDSRGTFDSAPIALGDVDGDRRDDFAVTIEHASVGQAVATARELVAFSGASGRVLWRASGEPFDCFAFALATIGDLDGDGATDVVAGCPPRLHAASVPDSHGRLLVMSGRTGALVRTIVGSETELDLGVAVTGVGDCDGDGVPDIVAAAQRFAASNGPRSNVPPAIVWFSGASGAVIRRSHAELRDVDGLWTAADQVVALRGGFDLDGDGIGDIVTSPFSLDGSAEARSGRTGERIALFANPAREDVDCHDGRFATTVDVIDDLDGDGRPDVLVGHPHMGTLYDRISVAHVYSSRSGERLQSLWEDRYHALGWEPLPVGGRDGHGRHEMLVATEDGACARALTSERNRQR